MSEPAAENNLPRIDKDAIYSVAQAAQATGFGETFIRKAIKKKALYARRLGPKLIKIKGVDLAS